VDKARIFVAALTLSASAFVTLVVSEGYTDKAVIPTVNDRPTNGFGSTFNADGSAVKLGEVTTPVRALITAQAHISKEEQKFRDSLPGVKLYQGEYDIYMNWVYQFGIGNWMQSSMRRNLMAGDYVAACNSLLLYKYSGGFDCSTPGNKRCAGVWTRQQERNRQCLALQN
jgi:lysozyme